jgi:hypothetical protein
VPGAGTYNIPDKIIESPGKSMAAKLKNLSLEGKLGPGPGGYTVEKPRRDNLSYS